MHYNDPKKPEERTRMLRRIWECEVYTGDPDDPEVETRSETVIAWNAVDANRKVGGQLAKQPRAIGWVSWPRGEEDYVHIIPNSNIGPDESVKIRPSVGGVADEEDWDF